MELRNLLGGLNYTLISGNLDICVNKIFYDSRLVEEGGLFVAIKGYQVDGHKYISSAISKGARVIVSQEEPVDKVKGITYIMVVNSRFTLSKLSSNYYSNPSQQLKVIGITGTNGKTSTSLMLKSILEKAGKKVGVIGTIGNYYDGIINQAKHTTPESLDLQELLYHMGENSIEYVIMEVSSHGLQLDRVSNIRFTHGIFTNLTQDHLDFHENMDSYFEAKKKLFTMNQGINYINTDDPYGRLLYEELIRLGKDVVTYGLKGYQNVYAKDIHYLASGVQFTLKAHSIEQVKLYCPIPGKFTLYNILGAISIAIAEDIPLVDIVEAIKNMPSVPGRVEKVETDTPFDIIIDFAHTPDGLKNVLASLKEFSEGRLITLFGCGGDRDEGKRPIMGKIAGKYSDFCIVTSDNPRSEDPEKIIEDIIPGVKETNCEYVTITDRVKAIQYAMDIAKPKDIVLIAGKGHEKVQIFKDKTIEFDEIKIVKEYLEK